LDRKAKAPETAEIKLKNKIIETLRLSGELNEYQIFDNLNLPDSLNNLKILRGMQDQGLLNQLASGKFTLKSNG
jgi:hypothetical protein